MTYKTVSNNEGTHVILDGVEIAIKSDRSSALDFVAGHAEKRAEAAEARAAMLQEALGPNARILNQRRDDQIKQLTAERDEARRQLSEAQRAIDAMAQIVGSADEVKHQLEQARSDIEDYRAEIARLLQAATTPKHIQEALNEGDGVYRP